MKRTIFVLILLQVLAIGALAASRIIALPSPDVQARCGAARLFDSVRDLDARGYKILHYNDAYVLCVPPSHESWEFSSAMYVSEYPPRAKLYLVGNIPIAWQTDLSQAGKVLLDLGSALLLESSLPETELRKLTDNPFTLLSLEPMRFPDSGLPPEAAKAARTDIDQMLALVSVTSVQSLIQSMQDMQTRYALAPNHLQVAQWIQQQFTSYGIPNVQLQSFNWQNTTQYNVVATIPGTVYPNQYIVVGGHHDSTSGNSDPMTTAPGADDNASGSVAALEMARVMMASGYQPRTSIRFVTFAAEEFGLWGSKYYAQNALENNQNIRLMINHDMIANNTSPGTWQVRLMPYDGSEEFAAHAAMVTENYTDLETYYGTSNSGSSDSHPFWQRGYHVIYFFESDFSEVYHSDQDLVANINPPYCTEVIKASIACAASFADMPAAPYNVVTHDTGTGTSLQVTWQGYNDPFFDHYRVYQSTSLSGPWSGPATVLDTTYVAQNLTQGQLYYFAVSTFDIYDNESYWIYTSGTPLSVPLEPQNFSDQPLFHSIELNWNPNDELDLAGYLLYRSQTEGILGTQIGGTITQNSYLDSDVTGSENWYYYSLCAVDNDGNSSPFAQVVKSRPVTLDHGVLIVDETEDMGGTNPFQPTDAQADTFYSAITQNFTTSQLDLNELGENLRLADLGIYSSLIWHGNDQASMDYPYFAQNALSQYILAGGNVFFSVYSPSMAFDLNATYPADFDPDSFIYSVIGIGEADYESTARFKFAIPVHDQFPAVAVDPNKTSPSLNGHILKVESIGPNPDCATVYNYGSDYGSDTPQGAMNGMPVGVLNMNNSGKVCVVSFPLYNMYQDDAQDLVEYVLTEYFNEETTDGHDHGWEHVPAISIWANCPNPFSGSTSFRIELKNVSQPLDVGIYNLRGQRIKTVERAAGAKSRLYNWDGTNDAGEAVADGVYFIRASQKSEIALRRMVLLN